MMGGAGDDGLRHDDGPRGPQGHGRGAACLCEDRALSITEEQARAWKAYEDAARADTQPSRFHLSKVSR